MTGAELVALVGALTLIGIGLVFLFIGRPARYHPEAETRRLSDTEDTQ